MNRDEPSANKRRYVMKLPYDDEEASEVPSVISIASASFSISMALFRERDQHCGTREACTLLHGIGSSIKIEEWLVIMRAAGHLVIGCEGRLIRDQFS